MKMIDNLAGGAVNQHVCSPVFRNYHSKWGYKIASIVMI